MLLPVSKRRNTLNVSETTKKTPNTNNLLSIQNTRKKQGSLEFAGNLWQEMDKTPSTPALSNKNECLPIRLNAAFL